MKKRMLKKALILLLAILTCTVFCACGSSGQPSQVPETLGEGGNSGTASEKPSEMPSASGESPETPPTPPDDASQETENTHPLTSATQGVKVLGVRNLASDSAITCDWSCSGIELTVDHKGGDIRFRASSTAGCYFRAYVDSEEWLFSPENPYYTLSTLGNITLTNVPAGIHTIRVIKVTGYTLARAQIQSVTFKGEILADQRPADRNLCFEFVGDSITCGWGTIGAHQGAYTDQDGTYAYSYLLAERFQADYAMTALSGQGLLCGNPGVTNGYLYASALRSTAQEYGFSRKADVVVINIGTNDYSKRASLGISGTQFKEAYTAFLQTVKDKNGETCKIICLYNSMNDTFANEILEACAQMGGTSANIHCLELPRAAGNQHPNIAEHQICADILADLIDQLCGFSGHALTLVPAGDGDMDATVFPFRKE